jgi:hypothetical protein
VQTVALELGVRVHERWMIGLHGGAVSGTTYISGWQDFMGTSEDQYSIRTIQYGITAQYAVNDHLWIAPWLGAQDSMRRLDCYISDNRYPSPADLPCMPVSDSWKHSFDHQAALGFAAGLDVIEHDGHRLSVDGEIILSKVRPDPAVHGDASYRSISIGLAYRFWR